MYLLFGGLLLQSFRISLLTGPTRCKLELPSFAGLEQELQILTRGGCAGMTMLNRASPLAWLTLARLYFLRLPLAKLFEEHGYMPLM